jgi:hypothetical protein
MWLRELLLASGEWDWSAMELRAEGEVCGVEWMFGDRGSVCGCGGLLLPGQSPPGRFGVHSAVRRTGAHAPRRNCADNEQSDGSDGSDRRTACADQACEVEVVADSGYLRRGMTEFPQRWRSSGWKAASGNPVLNQDLWWELAELAGYHRVTWIHVGGDSGHADQERCDALAFESARQSRQDSAAEC